MKGGVEVAEVTRGEHGDVRIKLPPDINPEGQVARKLQRQQFYQHGGPFRGGLSLHIPEFACPVLILTRRYAEQQVEDIDQPIVVNCQEVETIKALQAAP